jgi:DNA processing protein
LEDVVVVLALHRLVWGGGWGLVRGALGVGSVDGFIERALADRSVLWWAGTVLKARFPGVLEDAARLVGQLEREGVGFAPFHSPGYPEALRGYRLGGALHRPLGLFTRPLAVLPPCCYVGAVGTRSCTRWGRRAAYEVGRVVAEAGFTLVTGLAECVDAGAVLGALEAGGAAVGVRPWLKPLLLPRESRRLLERHGGLTLASEHYTKPPTASPGRLYYLRNRVIAGMSELVVVVEARPGGGAMHQVEWSLKYGRRLAVLEHPDAGSEHHKAYETLAGAGATALKTPEDLRWLLEELKRGREHE